jgi:hypothetical protein
MDLTAKGVEPLVMRKAEKRHRHVQQGVLTDCRRIELQAFSRFLDGIGQMACQAEVDALVHLHINQVMEQGRDDFGR